MPYDKKLKFTILIFSTLISIQSFSQGNFKPGYIITHDYDTIYGELNYKGDALMGMECTYRDSGKKAKTYLPEDIFGYRFVDGRYYLAKVVDFKTVFLEYLVNGQLNLYYLRDESGNRYFIDKENNRLVELEYKESITKENGRTLLAKSKTHIGLLSAYTRDAPDLKEDILSIQKPEHTQLITLAKNYHSQVCDDQKCLVYSQKSPKINFKLEMLGGFSSVYSWESNSTENETQYGIIAHINMPRINEYLFLRFGHIIFNYNSSDDQNNIYSTIKTPIQIEYRYTRKQIEPYISAGINHYHFSGSRPAINLGFSVKTYKKISLSVNYDIDYTTRFNRNTDPILEKFSRTLLFGIVANF